MAARAKARKEAAIDLLEIAFGFVAEVGWRRFSLVEVMLPRGATSRTLARFVSGFTAARARAAPP